MNKQRLERTKRRADKGDPVARCELAHYLATLPSARKHRRECVNLLEFASAKGESRAQYALGTWYLHGIGVKKSFKTANALLLRAAKQGHPLAQFDLAVSLEKGKGVKKNVAQAFKWYSKAAERGDLDAQVELARCFSTESVLALMLKAGCFGHARRPEEATANHNWPSRIVTKMGSASNESDV